MSEDETRDIQEEMVPPQEPQETPVTKKSNEPSKTFFGILKADPSYPHLANILLWKDPVKTGLLFGIIVVFYLLNQFYDYTVITLLSYLALSLAVTTLGYANFIVLKAKWLTGKVVENPFIERFKDENFHVSPQLVEEHLNSCVNLIDFTVDQLKDVFYATNNLRTALWAFYFYLIATIGQWFEGATILFVVTFVSFTWPRFYMEKQKEVDHYYSIALVEADKYFQMALSKLPPAVTDRFPMLAPKKNK